MANIDLTPFSERVIYEDNHLLAVNKPAGWLVQGDQTGDETLVDRAKVYLKIKYQKPGAVFLHPTHRIDRPVSGAVLLARTDKALGRLTTLFREKKVTKRYLALVVSPPPQVAGALHHYLWKDERRNIVSVRPDDTGGAKACITHYEVLDTLGPLTLLLVSPITGRPHQIRAQLSAAGSPILGDLKYGAPKPLPDASIALHSWKISLAHPVQQTPLELIAPLPLQAWWQGIHS